jgi:hypothetical protein
MYRCKCLRKFVRGTEENIYRKTFSHISVTLVLVTVSFIAFIFPSGLLALTFTNAVLYGNSPSDQKTVLLFSVPSTLMLTKCVLNFYIYFFRGSKFRKETKEIFCKRKNRVLPI